MFPKIVDLFSGCGGLALGFEKAGFDVGAGLEISPEAWQSISYNLCYRYDKESCYYCDDITIFDLEQIRSQLGKEGCIVIGGPPCQAYSIAGKGKLKSLGKERYGVSDVRGFLYQDFLRMTLGLQARAVLMENVPESTNFEGLNVPEIVCKELESNGYNAFWTLLNSADYGVPQIRERVFVFAIRDGEPGMLHLPFPTHRQSDAGITRKRVEGFKQYSHFREPLQSVNGDPWVTVGDALSDLPVLFPHADSPFKQYSLKVALPYRLAPQNTFQERMRDWYGEITQMVTGNSFRKNTKDFPIFEIMKQGDNYLQAIAIAEKRFHRKAEAFGIQKGSTEYLQMFKKMVPVYKREKFENKWKKLDEKKPSHTLVAHLSRDTYSHLHPWEPRGISVREAARLQSFPDDYYFNCSMGEAFRQIGNAVPPLLAWAIAQVFKDAFKEGKS